MKKLMTMLAAAAMAFGLYATDSGFLSGTHFNDWPTTKPVAPLTTEGLEWDNISADSEIGTATWTAADFGEYGVPAKFDGEEKGYALNIKSALTSFATVSNTVDRTAGEKIYVDTLVKFTAFDVEDTASIEGSDAKLGVWIRENSDGSTNLFITAGAVTEMKDIAKDPVVYDCGEYKAGEWCRLTIKSMGDIGATGTSGIFGFVVYVNGDERVCTAGKGLENITLSPVAQYYADRGMLFPSFGLADITTLGFAGQGAIDDLVFTKQAPSFAADMNYYTVTWDATKIAEITIDKVQATQAELAAGEKIMYVETAVPGSALVSWTAKPGYVSQPEKSFNITNNKIELAGEIKTANVYIGSTGYATIAAALAEAQANDTITLSNAVEEAVTVNTAVTLDLNGKILVGNITANAALTIANTDDSRIEETGIFKGMIVGKVTLGETASLVVEGGYVGEVVNEDGVTSIANGGQFGFAFTGTFLDPVTPADGKTAVEVSSDPVVWEIVGTYALSVADSIPNGTVEIDPEAGDYPAGTSVEVTATPNTGYSLEAITLNGAEVDDNTFNMPSEAVVVSAVFTANVYTVTYVVPGVSDQTETVAYGEKPKAVPSPAVKTGYTGAWNVTDPADVEIKEDTTFTYTYTANDYNVNVYTNGAVFTTLQYTYGGTPPDLPSSFPIDETEEWDGKWYSDDQCTVQITAIDTSVADDQSIYAKTTAKEEPTPDPLDPERKDDYLAWAKDKDPTQLAALTDDQKIEAFLLDCDPTTTAIEDAKKAFKIASITQDAEGKWVVTVVEQNPTDKGPMYKNGYVEIVEYTDITVTGGKLYKAELRQTPVKVGGND